MSRNFYVRTCVKCTFANKIEAMLEMSLVTVKVEPRSTSPLSSAWEGGGWLLIFRGGGNAKDSLQILDFQRLVHQNPTLSVSISIAALI